MSDDELIERLRAWPLAGFTLMQTAADEIERLLALTRGSVWFDHEPTEEEFLGAGPGRRSVEAVADLTRRLAVMRQNRDHWRRRAAAHGDTDALASEATK